MSSSPNHYSILRGADKIVDHFFGVEEAGKSTRYGTRKTYLNRKLESLTGDSASMLSAVYSQIEVNWYTRCYNRKKGSSQNWRCQGAVHYNEGRKGQEVILEREIVKAMTDRTWYNNVPTSSGLCSPAYDKARNIDLVLADFPSACTFFELKWDANTPVFAAIEVVYRGILNVFTRLNRVEMGYDGVEMPMLTVPNLHLRVLAPAEYYASPTIDLHWLEAKLNHGLGEFATRYSGAGVHIDFGFEAFPPGLAPPFKQPEIVQRAVLGRRPLYEGRP